jgi:hypothetical protein
MMAKGLAWREGAEEGLAVEVTWGMLSLRYTVVKRFLVPKRERIKTEATETEAQRVRI